MKKGLLAAIVGLAMVFTSCSVTQPISATSNAVGSKEGRASGTCLFYALCFGADASIKTAAKNGGITKISTVDLQTKNVLGIIITYTCIVTGE